MACDYTVTLTQNLISSSTNLINSYNHSILECKADWASANGNLIEQQELHRKAGVLRSYISIEMDSLEIWNDWAEVCTNLKFVSQAVLVIFAVIQVFEGTALYRCIRPFLYKLLVIGVLVFLYVLVEANYALHAALSIP